MGWQQRSSGHKYASPSGHAFFVGGLTHKPIHFIIKCKICNFCSNWKKKRTEEEDEVPAHRCTINHVSTSGSMEPKAALAMLLELYEEFNVITKCIVLDDDAGTRALLRWSNVDWMANNNTNQIPQVPKKSGKHKGDLHDRPDNGKLPKHIPEPTFLSDPNHRKKLWTKELRKMLPWAAEKRHGLSINDVLRLGKSYGYMIRALKSKSETEFVGCGQAVLEHHFGNHEYCGVWCPRRRENQQQRAASDRFYRCKVKDAKLYACLQDLIARFVTLECLKELAHSFDTQVNESLNNTIAWLAPKNKCYGGSQSLSNRVSIAIGMNSIGLSKTFARIFKALSITMTPNVEHFLSVRQTNRQKRIDKCKTSEKKKERNKSIFDKIRKDEVVRRQGERKKKDAAIYKSGMHMADDNDDEDAGPPRAKKPKTNHKDSICPHCGRKGHVQKRSKQCLHYSGKPKQSDIPTAAAAQNNNEEDDNDAADDVQAYDSLLFGGDSASTEEEDEDEEVQRLNVI
jgi:hypothetical protein